VGESQGRGRRNVFQGGFWLDNIGVFDRSSQLPTGGHIDQADGTSWMAMYALNLMRIALELAQHNRVYEDIATKFFEHFLHIAEAMSHIGGEDGGGVGLWDEEDKFFYDVLHLPMGECSRCGSARCRAHPPVCGGDAGAGAARQGSRVQTPARVVPEVPARSVITRVALEREGRGHRRLLSLLRVTG